MAFQKNIQRFREDKQLTQEELAKAVGVSQPQIAKYENGVSVPNVIVGVQIAKTLGVTCEELVND